MAEEKFELYRYDPSLPAAIVFAILFLVTTSLHGYHMFRFRTWYWIPFVIGGTCKPSPLLPLVVPTH